VVLKSLANLTAAGTGAINHCVNSVALVLAVTLTVICLPESLASVNVMLSLVGSVTSTVYEVGETGTSTVLGTKPEEHVVPK